MNHQRSAPALALLVLLGGVFSGAGALSATSSPLVEVLRDTPHGRFLELRFNNGEFARGYAATVRNDTIHLRQDENQGPLTPYPLSRISGIREWRSNSHRGAAWGAASGALIIGSFGLLVGAYAASTNSDAESDAGPIIGATLFGASIGAAGGSLLGMGVGALSNSWREIWPNQAPESNPRPAANSAATRLGLFAGSARPTLEDYQVSRFAARVSVRKSLGRMVSLGPELSYHNFEGDRQTQAYGGTSHQSKENLINFALALNLRSQRAGLSPYATTGLGWVLSNEAYLGAHLGGGLRWQLNHATDLEFDVRYHFNFTPVDPAEVDSFWTLGLGLGFGL